MADGSAPIEGYSVERLKRQYIDFAGDKRAELEEQRTARHYYHGDQYTAAELKVLKDRKQPVVTTPRLTKKLNGIVGLLERLRQDPKAYPRTPQQESGADLGTAIIRYAMDEADWKAISPEVCLNGAVNGIGGIELSVEPGDHGDPDVVMSTVDPETFFYDQRSVRPDFSDARFMGIAKWIDVDIAVEMFPDQEQEIRNLVSTGASMSGQSEQTQDRETRWVNSNEKQLFLVEQWYLKGGTWHWCFYSANVEFDKGVSPWKDEKGKSLCRYVMYSANIDHDGDRYGFIRMLKSPTDETNARRSKALHVMHTRRIIASKGAVEDVEKARRESVRPDGYIEVNGVGDNFRFEFDDAAKAADWQSQIALLEESKNELEGFGPNPELLGAQDSNKQSGRAIQLLQQAGIAELGPFILAYRGWKLRVYRAVWNIIQQTWTAERYIRVTDNDQVAQFIQLNGLQIDPNTGQPTMVNALGSLDVDIILDEGPDTMNMMQDTYDTLVALSQKGAAVPPQVLIELSSLDGATKKKILGLLEQAQQPNPMAVKAQEAEVANAEAQVGETKSKALKNIADAHATMAEMHRGPEPQAPAVAPEKKPPSVAINFKDIPPEAQAQMLAQVGIHIHPAILAAHAESMAQQQTDQAAQLVKLKAQQKPPPQRPQAGA